MSALRFLFLTLSLAVDSVLSAEGQTINKTAEPGQDVTLPCETGKEKIHMILMEWTKPGLDPDVVLYYRGGQIESEGQHPSFKDRVHLQDGEMKDGNASLILKDVKIQDTGIYECKVLTQSSSVPGLISSIHLVVSPPPGTQEGGGKGRGGKEGGDEEGGPAGRGLTGLVLGLVSVLGIVAVIAAFLFRKRKKTPPPPEAAAVKPLCDLEQQHNIQISV